MVTAKRLRAIGLMASLSTQRGNGYFADILGDNIGRVDTQTGKVTLFKTPTLNSGPRRMYMDSKDHLWFGENYGNKIGMLDTETGRITEWSPPTP